MKQRPDHTSRSPHGAGFSIKPIRQGARLRLAQASACGLLGALLWVLPNAQAEAPTGQTSAVSPVSSPQPSGMTSHRTASTARAARASATGATAAAPEHLSSGKGPNCTGEMGMRQSVTVPIGQSAMVDLPEAVRSRTVGNPQVLDAMLISSHTLYLRGNQIGTTNMIVQGRSGSCSIIDVAVSVDPGGLTRALAVVMPEETGVRVTAVSDSLVLTGIVADSTKAQRIIELANAFVDRPDTAVNAPSSSAQGGSAGRALSSGANGANGANSNSSRVKLINMMHVAAPQQVMLEVKVAEVDKTLIDQLGSALNVNVTSGSWSFSLLSDLLSGGLSAITGSKANASPLKFGLDAQKTDQLTKILAEPNLLAISGQEASFLAGGKVFIPVPQSNGLGGSTIILQEEQFGVGLTFTPTVLDNGRINLKVAPEVSELSPTGVTVTAPGSNTTAILPLITSRRASTTVQLNDGQSFAIGGLLKNNISGNLKAIPGIGELPIIGALARDTSYQNDRTELVFIVTPHLVKPLPQRYPLPTDHFGSVNEAEVYATGNMEGHIRPAPTEAPVSAPAQPGPRATTSTNPVR